MTASEKIIRDNFAILRKTIDAKGEEALRQAMKSSLCICEETIVLLSGVVKAQESMAEDITAIRFAYENQTRR